MKIRITPETDQERKAFDGLTWKSVTQFAIVAETDRSGVTLEDLQHCHGNAERMARKLASYVCRLQLIALSQDINIRLEALSGRVPAGQ